MRLLDLDKCNLETGELALCEVPNDNNLRYAILSHRWQDQEVLFSDIAAGNAIKKASYAKIALYIKKARWHQCNYLWIDTCCIQKESSAELTEAINSMYKWYQRAFICYVHLHDVIYRQDIANSTWFSRGWTLQELLAPWSVHFYNARGEFLGDKVDIQSIISAVTGIAREYLLHTWPISNASIATRMSWASTRQTSVLEDQAYCLLGIFSVNLSLIYGEGSHAFHRLQQKIIEATDDHSIFAWYDPDAKHEADHGMLADSPSMFKGSGGIAPYADWQKRTPFTMTNQGLCIQLGLTDEDGVKEVTRATLLCRPSQQHDGFVAIWVRKLPGAQDRYVRTHLCVPTSLLTHGKLTVIYVVQNLDAIRTTGPSAVSPYYAAELFLSSTMIDERRFRVTHALVGVTGAAWTSLTDEVKLKDGRELVDTLNSQNNHEELPAMTLVKFPKWKQGVYVKILITDLIEAKNLLLQLGPSPNGGLAFDVKATRAIALETHNMQDMWVLQRAKRPDRVRFNIDAEYTMDPRYRFPSPAPTVKSVFGGYETSASIGGIEKRFKYPNRRGTERTRPQDRYLEMIPDSFNPHSLGATIIVDGGIGITVKDVRGKLRSWWVHPWEEPMIVVIDIEPPKNY